MFKLIKNKKGASLLEIVATITITSIALIMIYNILSFNIHQNAINHERTLNANIANGTLSYIKNHEFIDIKDDILGDNDYMMINYDNSCNIKPFSDDGEICEAVLNPKINNRQYSSDDIYAYVIPFNEETKIVNATDTLQSPEILHNHLLEIRDNLDQYKGTNDNAIRIIVIVKSSINERYDYLLEGVMTKDEQ